MEAKDYKAMIKHPQKQYMQKALALAQKAFTLDEVPIGALVVASDGTIISQGYNQVEQRHQQNAHAEIFAINNACSFLGDWRLEGCWLYVTLEPCTMCMSLVKLSRMEGVVYGAHSPLFGHHLDKNEVVPLYKKKSLQVISGIGKDDSVNILRRFFQKKRKIRE